MKPTFEQLADQLPRASSQIVPGVLQIKLGPRDATHRVFWDSGTHGQECATPLALLKFAQRYAYATDWQWPHVSLTAVVADGKGFDEMGYGFVGVDGEESCWPPLWRYGQDDQRYWSFVDRNSAWGNTARGHLPETHIALRQSLHDCDPTFVLSSHETVTNETLRQPFWPGCGLLVIENYPLSAELYEGIIGIPPGDDILKFAGYLARRWYTLLSGQPRWKRNAKLLADVPGWQIVSGIVTRYFERGAPLMDEKWMRYLELQGELSVGQGRILFGPMFYRSDWMVITEYATRHFGCPGVTTETFPHGEIGLVGLDWRIEQTFDFACAMMDTLEAAAWFYDISGTEAN